MKPALRPASVVMSLQRAAAAVPNALSFSRTAMRELVRGRWKIEKPRFELDAEGRGEVLYRLVGNGRVFHFFLVSTKLPEALKSDRNFAQSWDAMGVLCQGTWTPEREAYLRREVPKQRAGYADYDTLIYARGNRSGRLFEHVVESLASGHQPDARLIAPVGYILRTTAFIGNGQLGTRPLAGYEADHPFRRPYQAQFCSAFLLREYVFDLVDHLARARNPQAARLAPEYRRYLGLGNAAATGLVPFVLNHPHFMHQWNLTHERALADAKCRQVLSGDDACNRFAALLQKAIRHFEESTGTPDGVFAAADQVSADLREVAAEFAEFQARGVIDGKPTSLPWIALAEWAERHVRIDAVEVLHSIVVELYPDIADAEMDSFQAQERFDVQPEMPAVVLLGRVEEQYGWALEYEYRADPASYFWYRSTKAPRDVRRGVRGRAAEFEIETTMDTVRQVQRLWHALKDTDDRASVADVVCARPDLRHIVARVQSLAGLHYAELRANWLSSAFMPFAAIRFALSFKGLEKFEAALPKSVRGTFMQGAPIAQDVAEGVDGDWPFPLMPTPSSHRTDVERFLGPLPGSSGCAGPDDRSIAAVSPSQLSIAPHELSRMVQIALQGHGASLGTAEAAAGMVMFAHALDSQACDTFLRHCADGVVGRADAVRRTTDTTTYAEIDACGASALVAAPSALDLAVARAHASPAGIGAALVRNVSGPALVADLPLRCAERACIGALAWHASAESGVATAGFAAAGPDDAGPWFVEADSPTPARLHDAFCSDELVRALSDRAGTLAANTFLVICIKDGAMASSERLFEALRGGAAIRRAFTGTALARVRLAWLQDGVTLTRRQFDALAKAGETLLVPIEEEHRVLKDGVDPLKVF